MIECQDFLNALKAAELNFFTGVPDSLLKNFCYLVNDSLSCEQHIITANEGSAVGLAAGYHMSTGKVPVVYLQNSGLGNTVNPLLSIVDREVYSIPMILIIGWRGEPGVKDEPQHVKQGRVMLKMLESMEIPFEIIGPKTDYKAVIKRSVDLVKSENRALVFAVQEGTFGEYKPKKAVNPYSLTREQTIDKLLNFVGPQDAVVCTTGKASRELYELRIARQEFNRADFLTVGAMGHCSQIALGVALSQPKKRVFCFDGDGAMIMHMGSVATIGRLAPKNYFHIMINNGAHESVGGQETGSFAIDWPSIAKACGYRHVLSANNESELMNSLDKMKSLEGPIFFEIRTTQSSRKDLGRPKSTPLENKAQFMKALNS